MSERLSILTVTQITELIKRLIKENFDQITVEGEIVDFTRYRASGHLYFTLADEAARLSSVMFSYANRRLDFQPEEGMKVIAEGRLDVYQPRGNYQLIVEKLQPSGRGKLEREFNRLKEKLEAEGAFAPSRKQELPEFPLTVGVVTSGDGAAFWDIVKTLKRRCPAVRVVLYPSRVNGREAAGEIARGIRRLPEIVAPDCLIVTRGGGGPEDLWAFNEEVVARAILDCPVPTISAVGHEVDITISDLVADHRSPTPTAAGEEVAPQLLELSEKIRELEGKLRLLFRGRVDRESNELRYFAEKQIFSSPESWLRPRREAVSRKFERLINIYNRKISEKKQSYLRVSERLNSLNPQRVMQRGYALLHRGEELVDSVTQVSRGDSLTVCMHDGKLDVKVVGTDL